jgi:transcriptional regulator with PAS, ATPase and Fis domain
MENHFQGILAVNEKSEIIFCNRFFEKLLCASEHELLGRSIDDVLPNSGLRETIEQAFSTWGEVLRVHQRDIVVVRYPIKFDGDQKGAILKTLFPDIALAKEVSAKFVNKYDHSNSQGRLHTCMDILGESEPMLLVKKLARRASRSVSNLLITGESGTGKSILAEAIHNRSVRRNNPFVKVNCAAIPETLLESELFGYDEGSFTGAKKKGKIGKFELANGGTLFLDEIGDMPIHMQAKLLQAIQDKRIERVGGTDTIDLDVRIIAATNKDLMQSIKEHTFREDLFYRLKVLEIKMPSLRERPEDIPEYISGLLKCINKRLGSDAVGFTEQSVEQFKAYEWPGNVRQLENFLEQAVNYSDDAIISLEKLDIKPWDEDHAYDIPVYREAFARRPHDDVAASLADSMSHTERDLIISVLKQCNGNKTQAAKALNIQRSALYKKLKRLQISL